MNKTRILAAALLLMPLLAGAQVWVADNGDGTYRNPIIHADYSDPDVIRTGDDYYMVASSFTCAPGIPVLHSKDLVNWTIINHVYPRIPRGRYDRPAHGQGSWAPSIRYHKGRYYVYFCTPEEGLYVAYTSHPAKKWTLKHVLDVAQWEDPCPLWDDDGQAYLVRSKLCGGPVYLHRMSPDGLEVLDNGKIIYWDDTENPVLEGLKTLKRDGWYYILAPAGGVATGWQTVLRSRNIEGPYESRKVLEEGNGVNGPHQGGFVETQTGEWWFVHFQDKGVCGRIVHLQPGGWKDGWPVMGVDIDNDGCGEPVLTYRKPNVGKEWPAQEPQTSDEFDGRTLGLQWQWQAAPRKEWYTLNARKGHIRLYACAAPTEEGNLYYSGNLMLQKFPAPVFTATAKMYVGALQEGERAGLVTMGNYYTYLGVTQREGKRVITLTEVRQEGCSRMPRDIETHPCPTDTVWLRMRVTDEAKCQYAYSTDGTHFKVLEPRLHIDKGQWIGAKVGLFCVNPDTRHGKGYTDVDYFRVE